MSVVVTKNKMGLALNEFAGRIKATYARKEDMPTVKPIAEKVGNSIVFHDVTPRQLAGKVHFIGKIPREDRPGQYTQEVLKLRIDYDPNEADACLTMYSDSGHFEYEESVFPFVVEEENRILLDIDIDLPDEESGYIFEDVSYDGYDVISDGDLSWRIAEARQSILDAIAEMQNVTVEEVLEELDGEEEELDSEEENE